MRQNQPGFRPERQAERHEPTQFRVHRLASQHFQVGSPVQPFPCPHIVAGITVRQGKSGTGSNAER